MNQDDSMAETESRRCKQNQTLLEIVEMCRAGRCRITLHPSGPGVLAVVESVRLDANLKTSVWLDVTDPRAHEKLRLAVQRTQ